MAVERGIPVLEVAALSHPAALDTLASYCADIVCVACFPWRLPRELLELPRLGCVNLHPSLLPANRGPAPLFWTFRHGEPLAGVTVHLMSESMDAGDILEQEEIPVPDGISGEEIDRLCSSRGAELIVRAARSLAAGTATPRVQPSECASYLPWPTDADFEIAVERSARWAYNFIRGVSNWDTAPEVRAGGERFRIRSALSYAPAGSLKHRYMLNGDELWVQCAPGVLRASLL